MESYARNRLLKSSCFLEICVFFDYIDLIEVLRLVNKTVKSHADQALKIYYNDLK